LLLGLQSLLSDCYVAAGRAAAAATVLAWRRWWH
jgi:hypothetical protein